MILRITLALVVFSAVTTLASAEEQIVYFGTGGGDAQGIYAATLDLDSGELSEPRLAAEAQRPGFLAISPNREFLYSVAQEKGDDGKSFGAVQAYAIGDNGKLKRLNAQACGGQGPCHLTVDQSGKCVLVANYGDGTVAALPIQANGSLGKATSVIQHEGSSVNERRQQGPHAHSINVSPDNRFAFAADLGTDEVLVYQLNADDAKLTPHSSAKVAPGSGPRHFAFHSDGEYAYVINELLSTVTAFDYDAEAGTLTEVQTIPTLPDGFDGQNTTAEVQAHPSGKFVYGSNRGHDTIAVFACDSETGKLTFVEHEPIQGKRPRNFGIDPSGRYLLAAGQDSHTVAVFRIDPKTGELEFTGSKIEVPSPICVKFLAKEK